MQGALTGIHGRPRIAARLQCKVSTPGQGWLSGCRSGDWQGDAHPRSQGYSSSSKTKATVLTECSRRNKISARERQGYYNESDRGTTTNVGCRTDSPGRFSFLEVRSLQRVTSAPRGYPDLLVTGPGLHATGRLSSQMGSRSCTSRKSLHAPLSSAN